MLASLDDIACMKLVAIACPSLTYFEDADDEKMPRMLWEKDWRKVKTEIRKWVKGIVEHGDI